MRQTDSDTDTKLTIKGDRSTIDPTYSGSIHAAQLAVESKRNEKLSIPWGGGRG